MPGMPEDEAPAEPSDTLLDTVKAREDRERALAEQAAEAPEPIPFLPPRRLVTDQSPERVATTTVPEPYKGIDITLWINPSAGYVAAVARSKPLLRDFMWEFMRGWTLMFAPEKAGDPPEPVPFTYENSDLLGEDVYAWMAEEFRRLRTNPLAAAKPPTSEVVREKSLSGGGSKDTRNGSG